MANGDITVRHDPHPLYLQAVECQARRQRFGSATTLFGREFFGPSMGGVLTVTTAGIVVSDSFGASVAAWGSIAEMRWGQPGSDMRAGQPPGVYPSGTAWVIQADASLVGFYPDGCRIGRLFDTKAEALAVFDSETAAAVAACTTLLG